jgi:hypothetical protein
MTSRPFMAALFVWTCAACSSTARFTTQQVQGEYSFAKHPERGLLVASTRFSSDCKAGETPSATLSYLDDLSSAGKGGVIPVASRPEESNFQDPPGYFVVQEVEGREYELRNLSISLLRELNSDLRIPFTVDAGKAVYLGELHVRYINCDTFPSVSLQVTDQWERDAQLFQARVPNVRPDQVVKRLLPPVWPPVQQ